MHLLQVQPGEISDGSEPVDLGQTPADVLVISAADTEIAGLSAAFGEMSDGPESLRLANISATRLRLINILMIRLRSRNWSSCGYWAGRRIGLMGWSSSPFGWAQRACRLWRYQVTTSLKKDCGGCRPLRMRITMRFGRI
jgi:hypothetical protein